MYAKISQKRKGNKDKNMLPINEYLIDNATDLSSLPTNSSKPIYERCGIGSTAFCVGEKNYYILNNSGNWVFYKQEENIPEEIVSAFADFSDRFKKGIDGQGQIVAGAIAEGYNTTASGTNSHAEGQGTKAIGQGSHAEGGGARAEGASSHAEGGGTQAKGDNSHAEGGGTSATGASSHAEGGGTHAVGINSHAEGSGTTASGDNSHAEGGGTSATGAGSHAEGGGTHAVGINSHAGGTNTIASGQSSYVIGRYNTEMETQQANDYAFIIGNGTFDPNTSELTRSNAFAVKWDGTFVLANGTEVSPSQVTTLLSNSNTNSDPNAPYYLYIGEDENTLSGYYFKKNNQTDITFDQAYNDCESGKLIGAYIYGNWYPNVSHSFTTGASIVFINIRPDPNPLENSLRVKNYEWYKDYDGNISFEGYPQKKLNLTSVGPI